MQEIGGRRRNVPAVIGRPRWRTLLPLVQRRRLVWGSAEVQGTRQTWHPRTLAARVALVALHLAPGLLAYGMLRTAREPLQRLLGISSADV